MTEDDTNDDDDDDDDDDDNLKIRKRRKFGLGEILSKSNFEGVWKKSITAIPEFSFLTLVQ